MASVEERAQRGRALRRAVPRSSHARWRPPPDRADPVALLAEQDASRLPELVPIRYGRMVVSAFAFLRGAALPMASDLAGTPCAGPQVQLCGDAHLANLGVYTSPERSQVFDVNDSDETLPGPFEWDVKRLAASLEVAARQNGFGPDERRDTVEAAVRSYREAMGAFAGMRTLDVWYARADIGRLQAQLAAALPARSRDRMSRALAKARTRDSLHAFGRLTEIVDGTPRIRSDPPLLVPIRELMSGAAGAAVVAQVGWIVRGYRRTLPPERRLLLDRFRVVDVARKVVGVGSVGTRCWIVLLLGRGPDDPLFLQVKESGASVLEGYLRPSAHANAGQRVVLGQRAMQAVSDIFLGWYRLPADGAPDGVARDFHVRQLRDGKGSVDVERLVPDGMFQYGRLCGWSLASAHARTGDAVTIAAYLGGGPVFDTAIGAFARAYADQTEHDHRALVDAVAAGRVDARPG